MNEYFAGNLRHLRKQRQISQQALGRKVFASRSLIRKIETGKQSPSLHLAIRIAAYFETSLTSIASIDLTVECS